MKLVWSRLARAQLLEAFAYIAERNVEAASRIGCGSCAAC
jgi:plasmid stabilization system protein ParE